jgi:hypothetical protein
LYYQIFEYYTNFINLLIMKTLKFLAVALFVSAASFAQQGLEVKPAQGPTVVQTPKQSTLKWESDNHDFGTLDQNKPATYQFTFTNTTGKDVLLTAVKPACGCTAANYTKTVIKPGEKGFVEATYNAAAAGPFNKSVTVTTNEEGNPSKTLVFRGTVKAVEAPAVAK